MKIKPSNGQTVKFNDLQPGDVFRNGVGFMPFMKTEVSYSGMGNMRNCVAFDGFTGYMPPSTQVTRVEGMFVEGAK